MKKFFAWLHEKGKLKRLLYWAVVLSFCFPIAYMIVKLIGGQNPYDAAEYNSVADYALMIFQCVLGLAVINIPSLLAKKFRFEIPMFLYEMYILFLYGAIFLGEVKSFYYLVPHWDVIQHAFSGLMLGFFGFLVITILNRDEHVIINLSPIFTAVFAFCFAVTFGALWEICEFTIDGVLGFNMQKFITAEGAVLVGHDALRDTMKDIIIDTLAALVSSACGYFAVKRDSGWLHPKLTK